MDGVLWTGKEKIESGPQVIRKLTEAGKEIRYVSNTSSRSLSDCLEKFTRFGYDIGGDELFIASRLTAKKVAQKCQKGAPVYVIGSDGLREEIANQGLKQVDAPEFSDHTIKYVIAGHDRDFNYKKMKNALKAFEQGAGLAAVNLDATYPGKNGLRPAGGAIVGSLKVLAGEEPEIMPGKPEADLLQEAVRSLNIAIDDCLMIGDTPEADVKAAHNCGMDSALVLSGNTSIDELDCLPADETPDYVLNSITDFVTYSEAN